MPVFLLLAQVKASSPPFRPWMPHGKNAKAPEQAIGDSPRFTLPHESRSFRHLCPEGACTASIRRQSRQLLHQHLNHPPALRRQGSNRPHQLVIELRLKLLGKQSLSTGLTETQPLWRHPQPAGQHQQLVLGWNRFSQQPFTCRVHGNRVTCIAAIEFPRQISRPIGTFARTSKAITQTLAERISLLLKAHDSKGSNPGATKSQQNNFDQ